VASKSVSIEWPRCDGLAIGGPARIDNDQQTEGFKQNGRGEGPTPERKTGDRKVGIVGEEKKADKKTTK
jgi:hypothetical protein